MGEDVCRTNMIRGKTGKRQEYYMAGSSTEPVSYTHLIKDVHWLAVASASVLSGILSLLNSVAGLPELKDDKAD